MTNKPKTSGNWLQGEGYARPMAVARSSLRDLHDEFDQIVHNLWNASGFPRVNLMKDFQTAVSESALLRPSMDISENDKAYVITAEIPGVEEDKVDLQIKDGQLILKGEKTQSTEEKDQSFHRIERSYGSFQRVLTLPDDVDENAIDAAFKNGVLKITLPRKAESKSTAKNIKIKKQA